MAFFYGPLLLAAVIQPNPGNDPALRRYRDQWGPETKVTVERVPAADEAGNKNKDYGRMVVTAIEFID